MIEYTEFTKNQYIKYWFKNERDPGRIYFWEKKVRSPHGELLFIISVEKRTDGVKIYADFLSSLKKEERIFIQESESLEAIEQTCMRFYCDKKYIPLEKLWK